MSYDDIRFSGWDDPDEDDILKGNDPDEETGTANPDYESNMHDLEEAQHDDFLIHAEPFDSIEDFEPWDDECKMCGKERFLNKEGYCSSCWQIWNS